MLKTMQYRVFGLKVLPAAVLAVATSTTVYAPTVTAGHGAAWGVGGLLAGHMLTKVRDRDRAAVYTAGERQGAYAAAAPQVQYAAPPPAAAPPTTMTPEQKINQLNKLAAGGYITPQEYKAKKQAILDSL